jgi:ABC-type antimicrobial peptide transport system permease subunit
VRWATRYAIALVIAAIGLYSTIAYRVAQRTRELGVRMALGARASDVMGLIVRGGVQLTLAGIVIGGAIASWAAPRIESLMFQVSPRDPLVFGVVAAVLLVSAIAASVIPALRALRLDPNAALRAD